jgi:hypothetical protein
MPRTGAPDNMPALWALGLLAVLLCGAGLLVIHHAHQKTLARIVTVEK